MKAQAQSAPEELKEIVESLNLAENMQECIWTGDRNHKTIYVNKAFEKISGYTLGECIGRDCTDFFDTRSKKIIKQHHRLRGKNQSSQYEATLISKTGKKIPLLVSGSPTKQGGTVGIFTNISRLKKLSKQEKLFGQIIRNSTEAIVILDKNRNITLWNNGASKIFGYDEKEVLSKTIDIIIPEKERKNNLKVIAEVDEKKYIRNHESQRLDKSGNLIDVSISITKVLDENEMFIGYLIIYINITDQKKTSKELQKRFEAMQDAYKELGLQKRQMDYLYEIIDAAVSKDVSIENLEKLIVSAACMLTKCDGAVLRTKDDETNTLKIRSGLGIDANWWNKDKVQINNSIAADAFKNKRPMIVDNITGNPKHQGIKLAKSHRFNTLILIPFFVEDTLLGSLSLYSTNPLKFRLIETDFLEKFGKQCSTAIFIKKN